MEIGSLRQIERVFNAKKRFERGKARIVSTFKAFDPCQLQDRANRVGMQRASLFKHGFRQIELADAKARSPQRVECSKGLRIKFDCAQVCGLGLIEPVE